mmetsp:Transcript_64974/g.201198  ORF Transcript_64974/g.201198 Transcript_64974/m.201198 type:complete len:223 (+) Transcript_64974:297-965(+)
MLLARRPRQPHRDRSRGRRRALRHRRPGGPRARLARGVPLLQLGQRSAPSVCRERGVGPDCPRDDRVADAAATAAERGGPHRSHGPQRHRHRCHDARAHPEDPDQEVRHEERRGQAGAFKAWHGPRRGLPALRSRGGPGPVQAGVEGSDGARHGGDSPRGDAAGAVPCRGPVGDAAVLRCPGAKCSSPGCRLGAALCRPGREGARRSPRTARLLGLPVRRHA